MTAGISKRGRFSSEKRTLLSNIFSLGLLQAANYLLPLLTIPFLVRMLGPENFGLLAFATATIGYFILITDYGFNLSATRQISIARDDATKINEIFSAVMAIKALLTALSFCVLLTIVCIFEIFSSHKTLYLISFGLVIGQSIFPVWLFQGMERMRYITYVNIISKTIFTICIFMFVRQQDDYLLVPLFNSAGIILAGAWSLYLARKYFSISLSIPSKKEVTTQLREGWHIFISTISISAYTISTTFILGLLAGNTQAGYFSAAEKVIQAAKGIYVPVSQAIFPMISKTATENRKRGLNVIKKLLIVLGGGMLVVSVIIFQLSERIVEILLGSQYVESADILKILAFIPFAVAISNILGIQTMLNYGHKSVFTRILICAAVLGLTLSFVLVPRLEAIGTATTLLIVESFVSITMMIFIIFKLRMGKL